MGSKTLMWHLKYHMASTLQELMLLLSCIQKFKWESQIQFISPSSSLLSPKRNKDMHLNFSNKRLCLHPSKNTLVHKSPNQFFQTHVELYECRYGSAVLFVASIMGPIFRILFNPRDRKYIMQVKKTSNNTSFICWNLILLLFVITKIRYVHNNVI